MHRILFSVAFILLGHFHCGLAIKCWECNSKYDPNCGDPFKPHTLELHDCSQRPLLHISDEPMEATICRKLTQRVRGETRIIRSCGYLEPQEAGTCTLRAGTHLVFMDYCQCAGDGCNRADHMQQPPSLHLLLSTAALLYMALLYLLS